MLVVIGITNSFAVGDCDTWAIVVFVKTKLQVRVAVADLVIQIIENGELATTTGFIPVDAVHVTAENRV